MAYEKQVWVDHIEADGEVKQQGTAMDALHFNHIEDGVFTANEHSDKRNNPHNVTPSQLGFGIKIYFDTEGYLCCEKTNND